MRIIRAANCLLVRYGPLSATGESMDVEVLDGTLAPVLHTVAYGVRIAK